jgi:hypothetical protein
MDLMKWVIIHEAAAAMGVAVRVQDIGLTTAYWIVTGAEPWPEEEVMLECKKRAISWLRGAVGGPYWDRFGSPEDSD